MGGLDRQRDTEPLPARAATWLRAGLWFRWSEGLLIASVVGVLATACNAVPRAPAALAPPVRIDAQPRVVTAEEVTTEAELARRGEGALLEHRWQEAARAYRTLWAADPDGRQAPEVAFDLGLALEGLGDRLQARAAFLTLAKRFPGDVRARPALVRAASLDAYVEDWVGLAAIGDALLGRPDIEDVDRLVALGSRGLARVELGQDTLAAKDIFDGLDLSDRLHYGARDVLPVAVAQLRFALGELRRVRSERIRCDPLAPDFVERLDARCAGLLDAQAAYAMAVRSIDPHWAAMAGYRVGAMYRALHDDLVRMAPPPRCKTVRQKQIFYAFMHVRYRVLLEKGLREVDQTVALGERIDDRSAWIDRAREAQEAMRAALAEERAQLARMPFTESEVNAALDLLRRRETRTAGVSPRGPRETSPPRPSIQRMQREQGTHEAHEAHDGG